MGNKYVQTPNLDTLAKDGILFTHNCVTTSICMQSRATLYAGQHSSVHQTYFSYRNITMYENGKWNETLYPLMLQSGYHTGFFGKYHHSLPPEPTFTHFHSTRMGHIVNCHGVQKHVTQCNEDDGIEFLKNRPIDQPFFLTLSFFATHAQDGNPIAYQPMETSNELYENETFPTPITYSDEHYMLLPPFFTDGRNNIGRGRFIGRYDTPENYQRSMKTMYRMATEVDTACGNIIQLLKEQNVYDNTIIIFTTDNGNFHGEHGLAEKWYAYEESIRVPLIIKDPRMISSLFGTENDEFTLNIDLAPTILSAANVPIPNVMQGRDISEMYQSRDDSNDSNIKRIEQVKGTWRKEFFYEYWGVIEEIPNSIALVNRDMKFIYWTDFNYTQLFNLTNDPYEENDIYQSMINTSLLDEVQDRLYNLQTMVQSGLQQ